MAKRSELALSFAPEAIEHLDQIGAEYHNLLDRSRPSIKKGKGLSEKEFWKAVRNARKNQKLPHRSHRASDGS